MHTLVKAMLASVLGAGPVATMDASPAGALLISSLSLLMWLSIIKDLLDILRPLGF